MLSEYNLPKYFWAEAVNTECYVINRVNIRPKLNKTPYEVLKGKTPNLSHLKVFGCRCFVHMNGKESLGKFDAKADEGIDPIIPLKVLESTGFPDSSLSKVTLGLMGVFIDLQPSNPNFLIKSLVYLVWFRKVPLSPCLTLKPRK